MSKSYSEILQRALGDTDAALDLVKNYLATANGRFFETYGFNETSPNRITSADLVAVTFLSMDVSPRTRSGFLPAHTIELAEREGQISRLLESIPADLELHCVPADRYDELLGPDSAASRLFSLLKDILGEGRSVARHKLLARKRPGLIPVSDSKTRRELWGEGAWWRPWWEALTEDPTIVEQLGDIRQKAGTPAAHLSILRTADIIIWSPDD